MTTYNILFTFAVGFFTGSYFWTKVAGLSDVPLNEVWHILRRLAKERKADEN
ncbi:Uncharacterised protein [uncultured archaeon]|nr:Uncharacterised protein [uncultured archaeon]